MIKGPGGPGTASFMIRDLLLKGGISDSEIFKRVQERFQLEDHKRSYVAWFRQDLINKGYDVPGPKPKKVDVSPVLQKNKQAPLESLVVEPAPKSKVEGLKDEG